MYFLYVIFILQNKFMPIQILTVLTLFINIISFLFQSLLKNSNSLKALLYWNFTKSTAILFYLLVLLIIYHLVLYWWSFVKLWIFMNKLSRHRIIGGQISLDIWYLDTWLMLALDMQFSFAKRDGILIITLDCKMFPPIGWIFFAN